MSNYYVQSISKIKEPKNPKITGQPNNQNYSEYVRKPVISKVRNCSQLFENQQLLESLKLLDNSKLTKSPKLLEIIRKPELTRKPEISGKSI